MDMKKFLLDGPGRIKKIRPYWYLNYSKEKARHILQNEYDWQYYGGHHLENRMTAFFHSIYAPQKLKVDFRNNTLSAMVRNGQLDRKLAIEKYMDTPPTDAKLVKYFCKRLGLSQNEYISQLNSPLKFWTEFPTYKRTFEILRPLFYLLSKSNLVPHSFYLKYCFPIKEKK